MAPTTRSASSSSKRTLDDTFPPVDNLLSEEDPREKPRKHGPDDALQSLLKRSLRGVQTLERDNDALRKKVNALEAKLERVQSADDISVIPKKGKRSAVAVSELQKKVKLLNSRVQKLEKSKEKYRKRIHELSMKELKSEADELVDGAEFEVGDTAYKMRKLLREFHDLMVINSLEEEHEPCPICLENLKPCHCQSMPCQHMFCNDCVKQLKPEADGDPDIECIRCPQCRNVYARDELESVEYTASEQWDALLDVAKRWGKIDLSPRREDDTTEEEGEEEFIDDEQNAESTTGSEPVNPLETSPEPEGEATEPQTPSRLRRRRLETLGESGNSPQSGPLQLQDTSDIQQGRDADCAPTPIEGPSTLTLLSYAHSPARDKRKRLQELAEAKAKKRRL